MNLDPRRLVVLHAVNKYGGVVGAATTLRISPSAVSQQLRALERESGFALIDRSRRGGQRPIEFTTAGYRLIDQAERLVQVLDDAAAELSLISDAVSGEVRIAAFSTSLHGFVGGALANLTVAHPALQVQVREVDEVNVTAHVQSGRVDLAVVEDDGYERRRVPRGLHYEVLADDPFRLAVPLSWPESADLTDFADRPWIDGPAETALGHAMRRLRRSTGLQLVPVHECHEFSAALAIVGAGLAIVIVPELALAAVPIPPSVRVAAPAGLGARRLGLLYRRSKHEPTTAVRTVCNAIRAAVPNVHSVDR